MADTIGVKIQLDGAPEFANNMKQMAAQTKEFKARLAETTSSFDKNTSAFKKSTEMTKAYKNQLSALKNEQQAIAEQIEKVSNSENANETYVTNLKTKYADLQTQINETEGKLQDLGGTLGAVGSQLQEVGSKVSAAGEKISSIGGTLTATVTTPIAALATTAVKSFGEVDEQFRLVKATMGDVNNTAEDFDNLWNTLSEDAANSVYTMQDGADALLNFARQGFTATEAADMLEPALSLAAGTGADLAETTSGLGNAMKAFGAESKDAAEYADILATAQAQANTDTTNLYEAMSVAAPICKTVGWNIKDLATIVDIFGDAGISGAEGANALKTGLARLASPAKDGAEMMEKLGLSTGQAYAIFDDNGSMKDMEAVLKNLKTAFKGLSDQERLSAASAIFGKNQMSKWLTLIDAGTDTVHEYRTALDDCTGTANEMSDALMSGVGGSLEKLSSTFDVFKNQIGKQIQEPAQKCIDSVTNLMNAFLALDDETQQSIIKAAAMTAAVGPVLLVVGKLTTGIGNLITSVGAITSAVASGGTALSTFGSAIATAVTSPVGLAITGVTALAAGIGAVAIAIRNNDPDYQQYKADIDAIEQSLNSAAAANNSLQSSMEAAAENIAASGAELDVWRNALNECFDSTGRLNDGMRQTAEIYLDELNQAMGTNYSVSAEGFITSTDGAKLSLQEFNATIDQTIEAMKREALQEAVKDEYVEALQAKSEAQTALQQAVDAYNEALERGSFHMASYKQALMDAAEQAGIANETVMSLSNVMTMAADTSTYTEQQVEIAFTGIASSASFAGKAYEGMAAACADTNSKVTVSNGQIEASTAEMASKVDAHLAENSKAWEEIPKEVDKAKSAVDSGVDSMSSKITGANFTFPHIKLPHFSISGSFSLNPPSAPHFSVDWYAKAMGQGMILNSPTIFGASGGRFLGAGESGSEVVVGSGSLYKMIASAVGSAASQPITVNVYGTEGQDVNDLADAVADRLNNLVNRQKAVFA